MPQQQPVERRSLHYPNPANTHGPDGMMLKNVTTGRRENARPLISASNYNKALKALMLVSPHKDDAGLSSGRDGRM